ncbi:MAG: hypothetical protein ABW202_11940 [Duganella sp.]
MENNVQPKLNGARDGVTQINKDLRADAHATIDRVADKVPPTTDRLATSAHNSVDKVADTVDNVSHKWEGTVERISAGTKQLTENAKVFAENGRTRVRANPALSVLIAAAAGYGISKLIGSRK